MTQPHLFCFGLGYSAEALARRLAGEGWRIAGTCRSAERRAGLMAAGIESWLFDRARPLAGSALEGTTHLLSSVPPDDQGDPVLDLCAEAIGGLRGVAWVGYLSTTSVYGDRAGGWVDERSELRPKIGRASCRERV